MRLQPEVIGIEQMESILNFSRQFLEGDEMQVEMASWNASWRKEALEFYLPTGWCLGIFSDSQLKGYFLAQPFLFINGNTQTLWVETLLTSAENIAEELIQTAIGLAREKHLQRVVFPADPKLEKFLPLGKIENFSQGRMEVTTVKK